MESLQDVPGWLHTNVTASSQLPALSEVHAPILAPSKKSSAFLWTGSIVLSMSLHISTSVRATHSRPCGKLKEVKSWAFRTADLVLYLSRAEDEWRPNASERQESTKQVLLHIGGTGTQTPGDMHPSTLLQLRADSTSPRHYLSFILENKALTKVFFSVSQLQSTKVDRLLPWKSQATVLSAQAYWEPPNRTEKLSEMLFLIGTNIHGTMSCYAVQCLSERTRLAVTDSVDNTSLLLYMKLKNSCKYTAIGAASQHLPWKRSKQKCNCLQSPHSILLLLPQKDESSKRSLPFSGNHLRLFYVLFVSEPFCSSIT